MNNRERALAILNYQAYDRVPVVHFGYWHETLQKWADEGHISREECVLWGDGNVWDTLIAKRLGFDFNWSSAFNWNSSLRPGFEEHVVRELGDGGREVMNSDGVIVLSRDEAGSIPAEIAHTLVDRKSWQEHYLPRLEWSLERIDFEALAQIPAPEQRDRPLGIWCGSLWGRIRDITGVVGLSYLMADDPELVDEMVDVTAEVCYQGVKAILERYDRFDFGHYWEDICYRAGPLVNPKFFNRKIGPHYRRITDLLHAHGIELCSLDCDGKIDKLIPTWVQNGVNTMFPIEVGTWDANIAPWRELYGRELRGVGGVSKTIFAYDRARIDAEIERIRPMVDLGGYVPCLDHRIPPDAKWENVQYYCERFREVFG